MKREKNVATLNSRKSYSLNVYYNSVFKSFKIYLRLFFKIRKSRIFKSLLLKTVDISLPRKLMQLYQNWYYKIKLLVSINTNNMCNRYINHLIYIWIKKKKGLHNNITKLIYIVNTKLNRFFYVFNINKHYTNYYNLVNE